MRVDGLTTPILRQSYEANETILARGFLLVDGELKRAYCRFSATGTTGKIKIG